MPEEPKENQRLEIAHVLFLDIVGYSTRLTDEQRGVVDRLNQAVRSSDEFNRAAATGRLKKVPTGDGMALIFYHSREQPVECAVEISRVLRHQPDLPVRLGSTARGKGRGLQFVFDGAADGLRRIRGRASAARCHYSNVPARGGD